MAWGRTIFDKPVKRAGMKQINILWEGREYHSMENCLITAMELGWAINSVIVGIYKGVFTKWGIV